MATDVLYWNKTTLRKATVSRSVRAWSGHQETLAAGDPPPMYMTESLGGGGSWLSSAYSCHQVSSCLRLLRQPTTRALSLALASAGKSRAARMAMMAITTSSSMSVNATVRPLRSSRRERRAQQVQFTDPPSEVIGRWQLSNQL